MILSNVGRMLRNSARLRKLNGVLDIPILCYHQIGRGEETSFPSIYTSRRTFERQLRSLIKLGYRSISLTHLAKLLNHATRPSEKYFAITFDDGYTGVYENAFPLLQQYGCKADVFVIAHRLRDHRNVTSFEFLDAARLREMQRYGVAVGSHSLYHSDLSVVAEEPALRAEIYSSKQRIEDALGAEVPHFAYPLGKFTERVIELVIEAGYVTACTSAMGRYHCGAERFKLRRIPLSNEKSLLRFIYRIEVASRSCAPLYRP